MSRAADAADAAAMPCCKMNSCIDEMIPRVPAASRDQERQHKHGTWA